MVRDDRLGLGIGLELLYSPLFPELGIVLGIVPFNLLYSDSDSDSFIFPASTITMKSFVCVATGQLAGERKRAKECISLNFFL